MVTVRAPLPRGHWTRWAAGVVIAFGLTIFGTGTWLVLTDAMTTGEKFDGLGAWVGGWVVLFSLPILLCGLAYLRTRSRVAFVLLMLIGLAQASWVTFMYCVGV